jgi:hypothetical protein
MSKFDITYKGWSDEASPIKSDVRVKESHARLVGYSLISQNNKGKKLSDDTKKKISETSKNREISDDTKKKISKALKDKPLSIEHIESLKKTKLRYKISKDDILKAQKGTTTAKEVAEKLGIDFNTYKSIATFHKVYKKQSLAERNQSNGDCILAWEYNGEKGKFIGEFQSQNAAKDALGIKASLKNVLEGKYKQMSGYTFEYKNN